MKPTEILKPVTMLTSILSDVMFWLQEDTEQYARFKNIEFETEQLSILMDCIPSSLKPLSALELYNLSGQVNGYLESLNNMIQNFDLKKYTYVLLDTEFVLSPEFHRKVYLSVFNALNLLRSFERAIAKSFHPSGNKGLKPKASLSNGDFEEIYNSILKLGLINQGTFEDFKAIFTDVYLPGTWNKITFPYTNKDKSGIKTFAFELVEEITGQLVQPTCINKYFSFSDGSKTKTNNIKTNHRSKLYDLIFTKKR